MFLLVFSSFSLVLQVIIRALKTSDLLEIIALLPVQISEGIFFGGTFQLIPMLLLLHCVRYNIVYKLVYWTTVTLPARCWLYMVLFLLYCAVKKKKRKKVKITKEAQMLRSYRCSLVVEVSGYLCCTAGVFGNRRSFA